MSFSIIEKKGDSFKGKLLNLYSEPLYEIQHLILTNKHYYVTSFAKWCLIEGHIS